MVLARMVMEGTDIVAIMVDPVVEAVAAEVLVADLAHDRIEEVAALSLSVYHSIFSTSIETGFVQFNIF
jgi:hypothetical protein